jgi:enoyl-CoA hydratase/carnithine racemase
MVQWAVDPADLALEAEKLAQRIASQSAPALQVAKRCMAQVGKLAASGFEAELDGIHTLVSTTEAQTRIKAFLAPRG